MPLDFRLSDLQIGKMAVQDVSGTSTPFSSSSTLSPSSPSNPKFNLSEDVFKNSRLSASNIIEFITSRSALTSAVHIYDLAEQAGFGILDEGMVCDSDEDTASVVSLQTRAGAGLSLVGRLSEGTSQETARGAVLTAYTTPTGLCSNGTSHFRTCHLPHPPAGWISTSSYRNIRRARHLHFLQPWHHLLRL